MTNLLSIFVERWGMQSPRRARVTSNPSSTSNSSSRPPGVEFTRLEDRTLFSGTPLAEAAQDVMAADGDAPDPLPDEMPLEMEAVSDWAVLSGNLMYIDGPLPTIAADDPLMNNGRMMGTDADEMLRGNDVDGGYGDDMIAGTSGNDVLDGGHGEDRIEGGDGDDLIISRSDGREPEIARQYERSEDPEREINLRTRTYYPGQPIEADDVLIGGDGADTFRFEVLINAKEDIILKHVRDDGSINWGMKGVAGENDRIHDHWVDRLGDDVIWDFSRAEGDKIEIAGHTVDVYELEHVDTDLDGLLDATILHVQSNQGNGGGAHNKDQLGTITVFGDLVMESDFTVDAMVNYGIVDTIDDLDEAMSPRVGTPVDGSPPAMPNPYDGQLPDSAVFGVNGELDFDGERDHIEIQHHDRLALSEGTVSLRFVADEVNERHALFSKDASGYQDGGHLTAFVHDGRLEVRLQSAERSVWLKAGSVDAGQEYHLTVTFGEDGFWLYLDGKMIAWNTEFTQGLENNTENLAIGGNTWSRTDESPSKTYDFFDGKIEEFTIYGSQMSRAEVAVLAGVTPAAPPTVPTVVDGRLYGTDADETLSGSKVNAGYGDDLVTGTSGNDVLDGGHGEDRVEGGDGDDLIVSYADAREPVIAQNYNSDDDPDGEINSATRTLYPDQPIEADDVLIGGDGADTFYFRTLINAKEDIILKHVNDDGTINWGMNGVAGENNNVHDHWVEGVGNDVIWDFSRAEGDSILIEGHTTEVYKIQHQDSDLDGILDSTVLHLWSNQGNGGGAHNKDLLGTVTVFGDLVTRSDVTVNKIDYGIVPTVDQLDEAITPRVYTSVADDGNPAPTPPVDDGELPAGAVFGVNSEIDFDGEEGDYIEVAHDRQFALTEGTIALTFTADDVSGRNALFSKDASGYKDGGHLTAFVYDGRIKVRLQSEDRSVWLYTAEGSISAGEEHHLAVTFGEDGFWLYLDGRMADWETGFEQGLETNAENLVIGANTWARTAENPHRTWDAFDGRIEGFTVYNSQMDNQDVAGLVGLDLNPVLDQPTLINGTLYGTDADETLSGSKVNAGYGDDLVTGTSGNDVLDGGHGEDRVEGGDGDDLIVSYADAREPVIAQNYNSDDDPDGEINNATRTLYPDQPIEADDVLIGGDGADTFYFRTLINAKEDIILKHVNDDGTINWGMNGVAGENNNVHDHWVEGVGNDVIWDFSRAEGDSILIEGHTTEVYKIQHQDSDLDGILDSTVLHLWSNQGNGGGAHNKDLLGTVTVFGDLVTRSDVTVNKIDYGIVPTVDQLDEAITPRVYTSVADDGNPAPTPPVDDGELPAGAVFGVNSEIDFDGEEGDYIEVAHDRQFALTEGTIALTFTADDVSGRNALFSKDASGYKDGGHLTAFVYDGRIKVRLQSEDRSVWLYTAEGSISAGEEHHLAVTFGEDGFWLYLDGRMADWETGFEQGLETNAENLVIGANTWARTAENPHRTWDAFDGRIEGFTVYNSQMDNQDVAGLVGLDLNPVLDQPTLINGTLYGTDADETLSGSKVNAGYGDDLVTGTSGNDVLDGGHGEDRVEGGDGDDLIVSYADAREPVIAQNYNSDDDPDGEINSATRTLYPDQPIEADDVLIGGDGADTFYFRTLINAKEDIILKHVNDDGTINWGMNGVAGENNNVHDHWVEGVGNDVIWDFSRAEGDSILIEGHTTEVYKIQHQDSDLDGILDSTVLHLWSNQGNGGGAHNKDLLGTVTVFGDLVTRSDVTVNKIDYGIVPTVDQLDEAITPRVYTSVADDGNPAPTPPVDDGELPAGAVFGVNSEIDFDGEEGDYIEVAHDRQFALTEGTIALTFTADDVSGRNALFSKDASGYKDGGHLTAFVYDGRIKVRLQSEDRSVWLYTAEGSISAGEEHHLAVTFGEDGFWLYLDGRMADWETGFEQGLETNAENLVIGANTWARTAENPHRTWDAFDGRIEGFTVYNSQMDNQDVAGLVGLDLNPVLDQPTLINGTLYGTDADETLSGSKVNAGYGDDLVTGTSGNDVLDGGHGEDRVEGGDGDDLIVSYADAREPVIAQNYNSDDDPDGEINNATRTLYPDQPIEADDVLIGGDGADTFYFRTLINAKEDIILKHVNDDGTINWGMNGVAGENNNVHDHWVEGVGNDVIWDFSRAEGDSILIEGHTTEVYKIQHQDSDLDGILDSTVLHLWSNQGNGGGAHNKDLLGTVTVFGDLVTRSDVTVNKIDYGIVPTVDQLDEAITPRVYTSVADDGNPAPTPPVDDGELPAAGVFGVAGQLEFDGEEDHIEIGHQDNLALTDGTIALSFRADDVNGRAALFSKDASGNRDGGHLTAFVYDGRIKVRLQTATDSIWLESDAGSIQAGQEHHLAVTFGASGFQLFVDGSMVSECESLTQGLDTNLENLAIGASTWSRTDDNPYKTEDHFDGRISGFMVYGGQLDDMQVANLAGVRTP